MSFLCLQSLLSRYYQIHSFIHLVCADDLHIYIPGPDNISNLYIYLYTYTYTYTYIYISTMSVYTQDFQPLVK